MVVGGEFDGHVGEGIKGDKEVMGKCGAKDTNMEGQMIIDFTRKNENVWV